MYMLCNKRLNDLIIRIMRIFLVLVLVVVAVVVVVVVVTCVVSIVATLGATHLCLVCIHMRTNYFLVFKLLLIKQTQEFIDLFKVLSLDSIEHWIQKYN